MKNLSDEHIIKSVLQGNREDYRYLVDRYKDRAYNLLSRMLNNPQDAEEVLQDAFVKAFNSLSKFRFDSSFSTWFYRIVYNTALTRVNSAGYRNTNSLSSIDDIHHLSFNADNYEGKSKTGFLNSMINKLPPKNGVVIILYYMDGLNIHEISEILGLSISNAKVILHRSRNALKDLLVKHNYQEQI